MDGIKTRFNLPVYAKSALLLVGFYVFFSVLSIGQEIILPLIYAGIIAISLSPAVGWFISKKIGRALSILIVLTIATLIIASFVVLLCSQASLLSEAWPTLTTKFQALLNQGIGWASDSFGISSRKINAWIADTKSDIIDNSGSAIGLTLTTVGGVLATALLTPVYVFMILFYQPHLIEFTHRICGDNNDEKVSEILTETKGIIQSYLVGLFAEFAIIATLNSMGLLLLGIEYALLLGILGALLNIVPYLGGLVAMVLFMVVALITKSPIFVLYVAGLYGVIQLIDNNYIVPRIIGSKVKLNALVSLLAVILGAALWGIPGMFLSIPLMAILKLIFDRIEPLKSWGFLLGDTMPPLLKLKSPPIISNKDNHENANRHL